MNDITRQILDTAKSIIPTAKSVGNSSKDGPCEAKPVLAPEFSTDTRNLSCQFLDTIKTVILASIIVLGVQYIYAAAWQGPTEAPTGGNPDAPVNVGGNPQVKNGDLGVKSFTADNTQINGMLNVVGAGAFSSISATAGTFSGAVSGSSLTATAGGAITGGSLDVGTGAVIGGQGTFTGGVIIGNGSNGSIEYLSLDRSEFGVSPSSCDTVGVSGKMYFDPGIGVVYVCIQGRSAPLENGWKIVNVKYAD